MELKLVPSQMGRLSNVPKRATPLSGAIDLEANIDGPALIQSGSTMKIETGLAISMASQPATPFAYYETVWVGIIQPRSGLGSKGIILANTVGLIDADYQGEILVNLWNTSDIPYIVNPGDRIAQMWFTLAHTPTFKVVTEFSQATERGSGGFGSTGT